MEIHDSFSFPRFDSSTDKRILCGSDSWFWISDLYSLPFYSLQTPTALWTDKHNSSPHPWGPPWHTCCSIPQIWLSEFYHPNYCEKNTHNQESTILSTASEMIKPSIWPLHLPVNERRRKYGVGDRKRRKSNTVLISVSLYHLKQMNSIWTVWKFTIFTCHYFLSHQLVSFPKAPNCHMKIYASHATESNTHCKDYTHRIHKHIMNTTPACTITIKKAAILNRS